MQLVQRRGGDALGEHAVNQDREFLGRDVDGANPGRNRIRIALVASESECAEGIDRIIAFARRL